MLWQRVLFGALMIFAIVGLVWLDDRLADSFVGVATAPILIVLVLLGSRELHRLFTAAGHAPWLAWSALVAVALAVVPFAAQNGWLPVDTNAANVDLFYTCVCLAVATGGAFAGVAARRKTDGAIAAMATTVFSILYLGLLGSFLARIRVEPAVGGPWLLLYFILTVKVCDIGAYFTGRSLGRHKLIAWLSPNKTWEGLAGGVTASILVAIAGAELVRRFGPESLAGLFPSIGAAAVFGLLMALIGTAGDLLESMIKRDASAKDSANAIPSFGGVLDILDSLLLTAPLGYWLLVK